MFTTYHLLFTAQVVSPLLLDDYSGSSLRGNLFEAVWKRFCQNKSSPSCAACPLHTMCPVSALVAPLREENTRGRDIPRPYIILPPLVGSHMYAPGETFTFGITLFGSIIQLLPYLIMSVSTLEENGLGQKLAQNAGERGRFHIQQIESYHPLTGERRTIYRQGQAVVQAPTLAVTAEDVRAKAERLPTDQLTLDFLTPTRIIDREQLQRQLQFRALVLRLTDRFYNLRAEYGMGPIDEQARPAARGRGLHHKKQDEPGTLERETEQDGEAHEKVRDQQDAVEQSRAEPDLICLAGDIRCRKDETRWEDVKSYSRRQRRYTPVGGFLGRITFAGELAPFRELLTWGELIHVGKSAVKGNGWYRVAE